MVLHETFHSISLSSFQSRDLLSRPGWLDLNDPDIRIRGTDRSVSSTILPMVVVRDARWTFTITTSLSRKYNSTFFSISLSYLYCFVFA